MKSDATKVAMSNALKEQLKKKKLSKITINDIASACNISRMTFYYHFQDIYDLTEWTLEEAAGRAIGENRTYEVGSRDSRAFSMSCRTIRRSSSTSIVLWIER